MSVTVNDLVVYHYEKQPSDFKVGELLHNFNGNDYRAMEDYGALPEPNERGEYETRINETLSHTEAVKADSYYEALDEVKDRYDRSEIVPDAESFAGGPFGAP